MTKKSRIARHAALVGAAAAVLGMAAATGASAAPTSWLPNATLTCGSSTSTPDQWVALPRTDSIWILSGDYAGHYVILSSAHYLATTAEDAGLAAANDYEGLPQLDARVWGQKTGMAGSAITCNFISQWGDGGPGTEWIVGPVTMAQAGTAG